MDETIVAGVRHPHVVIINPFDTLPGENFRHQRYTLLYELLRKATVDVTWLTSDFHHWSHSRRSVSRIPSLDRGNILLVKTLPYKRNISVRRFISYVLLSVATLYRLFRLPKQPDLILCVGPVEEVFLVSLYARLRKVPFVLDVVDLWPDLYVFAFPPWARRLARLLLFPYFLLAKTAYQCATHVTAVSATYARWAMQLSRRTDRHNFSYYYLGCRNDRFGSKTPVGRPEIISCLFAGQFGFSYDVELIIRAAGRLHAAGQSNVRFVLCGSGEQRKHLVRLAEGLPNVKFLGWVDPDTLNEIGMECQIGLCTYRAGATQSVPYKLFDYMSMGLFIVSSLAGEAASLLTKHKMGETYDPENLDSFLVCLSRAVAERSFAAVERGHPTNIREPL